MKEASLIITSDRQFYTSLMSELDESNKISVHLVKARKLKALEDLEDILNLKEFSVLT